MGFRSPYEGVAQNCLVSMDFCVSMRVMQRDMTHVVIEGFWTTDSKRPSWATAYKQHKCESEGPAVRPDHQSPNGHAGPDPPRT